MKTLSVIIPVYNSIKYLEQCVCSVLNQTFSNFELILVDDASTDGSSELCDELVLKDSRIKVLHHEKNQGLSISRNDGFNASSSSWITFLDNDDYICPQAFEYMFSVAGDAEIVCGRGADVPDEIILQYAESDWNIGSIAPVTLSGKQFCEKVNGGSRDWGVISPLWGKLIRRSLLEESLKVMLPYKEELYWVYFEDVFFGPILYYNSRKAVYCGQLMYLHRIGGYSFSKTASEYNYQGVYSKEISFAYFKDKLNSRVYGNYLIDSFLFMMSIWYRIWKYESDKAKKEAFCNFIDRMYLSYKNQIKSIKKLGLMMKIKRINVIIFFNCKTFWCKTAGRLYFG